MIKDLFGILGTINGEYLDYKNCKCRKKLVDKLVEECSENIDEKEIHPTELHAIKMIIILL